MGVSTDAKSDSDKSIKFYEKALLCKNVQKADVHFALAKLYHTENPEKAKRHVLIALEEAPRFEKAYKLLKKMKK